MKQEPEYCPYCGGPNITTFMVDWNAQPQEDQNNQAQISEHQCLDCDNQSFWT